MLACLLALSTGGARADTVQELATEAPVVSSVPDIELAVEDVSIALDVVDFKYELVNKTEHPAALEIMVRLPDLDGSNPDTTYAIPSDDPVNYNGSRLSVDSAETSLSFRQLAYLGNRDVTRRLHDAQIPLLASQQGDIQRALSGTAPNLLRSLIEDGFLAPYGSDPDGQALLQPAWTVKTSAVRRQRVAAGQRIVVELHALTSLGSSPDTVLRKPLRQNPDLKAEVDRYLKAYCVEEDFLKGIDKQAGTAEDNAAGLQERRIDIRLPLPLAGTTPVVAFHLAIDKGKPDNLISTCVDKLKKMSPTRFEVDTADAPTPHRVRVLVIGRF